MQARWLAALLMTTGLVVPLAASESEHAREPAGMLAPDGSRFPWWEWLAENGPVAALVWTSWVPRSELVLDAHDELRKACEERGLSLIVIDVQEPLVEAREALDPRGVVWVHDRHGAVLKRHRVFRLPRLLILETDGRMVAELEPRPEAVRAWSGP